jgi:glycosyltransferase involved in cell wall biosynthesis
VPFEAAAFGTPTVCVDFGSLAEHLGSLPVTAADWSVTAFAAAVEAVVADPAVARAQVAAVRQAATRHTWDGTASVVLRGYRAIVARPARR